MNIKELEDRLNYYNRRICELEVKYEAIRSEVEILQIKRRDSRELLDYKIEQLRQSTNKTGVASDD